MDATLFKGAAMWPALLVSAATGLGLGLARLKVMAVIVATVIVSFIAATIGVVFSLQWGTIALTVIADVTILQSSYLIAGLLSEAPSPRAAPRTNLRPDLVRAVQLAIGEELRNQFRISHNLPRQLRTRMKQFEAQYG
jgi:hypothetical protein